jgi:hypothetical protein
MTSPCPHCCSPSPCRIRARSDGKTRGTAGHHGLAIANPQMDKSRGQPPDGCLDFQAGCAVRFPSPAQPFFMQIRRGAARSWVAPLLPSGTYRAICVRSAGWDEHPGRAAVVVLVALPGGVAPGFSGPGTATPARRCRWVRRGLVPQRRRRYRRCVAPLPWITTGSSKRCGAPVRSAKYGMPLPSSTGARLMWTSSTSPRSSA